jgi:hypothetical protein
MENKIFYYFIFVKNLVRLINPPSVRMSSPPNLKECNPVLINPPVVRNRGSVYFWFHFPVIAVTGIVLSLIARPVFVLLRNSILLSGGVSLVIYWLFPVSPPRLVQGHDFVDTMGLFSQVSYQAQEFTPFINQYAAMPSLHAGWALLLVLAIMSGFKSMILRFFFILIFLFQLIAIICTGNHFWLDGLAGIAICLLAWGGALLLRRMLYFG